LLEAIETKGLIAYGDELLKYLLLQFIYAEQRSNRSVEKYNTIGKGIQGDFERWLRAEPASASHSPCSSGRKNRERSSSGPCQPYLQHSRAGI